MSAFAGGVLISQEITHEERLFGAEAETFVLWMAALGDRREFPEGHMHLEKDRDADQLWWSDLVDRSLEEGRTVFAYANNHFPSTFARFLEFRRGDK